MARRSLESFDALGPGCRYAGGGMVTMQTRSGFNPEGQA